MPDNETKIEQPGASAQKPKGSELRIFSMPQRYRHGAEAKLVEPQKQEKPKLVKAPSAPKPKAPAPKPPAIGKPMKTKAKSKTTKLILIVGGVLLVVLVIGGYLVVRSVGQQEVGEVEEVEEVREVREVGEVEEEEVAAGLSLGEEVEKEAEPFAIEPVPGIDSDSDGLTDLEEQLIYSTNPKLPDSDSDGFLDGNEVFHRYNPNGTATGGTLLESGIVKAYTADNFKLVYPSSWTVSEKPTEEGKTTFVFLASSGESFEMISNERAEADLMKEYLGQILPNEIFTETKTKNGFQMFASQNQLRAFVNLGSIRVDVTYDPGIKARIDYLQTFQMMLNSIVRVEKGEGVERGEEEVAPDFSLGEEVKEEL